MQYGLYTALMAGFVYCLFGTSKDASLGPAAIMSLLTAEFGHSMIEGDPTYAIGLSLVSGLAQITMGFLHIGQSEDTPWPTKNKLADKGLTQAGLALLV